MNRLWLHRYIRLALFAIALVGLFLVINRPVYAGFVQNRYVSISTAEPAATNVAYTIQFNPVTSANLGSISFQFCDNSPLRNAPCLLGNGLDITTATLATESGNTGFSGAASPSPGTEILISRTASAVNLTSSSYVFSGIQNPISANTTTFIRIALFSSTDGTGTPFDEGSVAFSTSEGFSVGAYVPPFLTFCVGQLVALDCSSTAGALLGFGELSENETRASTSQFSVATNDPTGYNTFITGQTMTSGNNVITALGTQAASSTGQPQFGLNLMQNTVPSVGANAQGSTSGAPSGTYGVPNQYRFNSGDLIASSSFSSEFTRYTASYIVNVPPDQPPGIYSTTVTYTAIASF